VKQIDNSVVLIVHWVVVRVEPGNMRSVKRDRPGFQLPLLLISAFRVLIDNLHVELAARGHPQARPLHGFALQAIGPNGASISELGRRLGVTKQAAAKTAAGLQEAGYVTRRRDPGDARTSILVRTPHGEEMLGLSAELFEKLRREWGRQVGLERLQALEDDLARIIADAGGLRVSDIPGWIR
jgi:DNA-binding MarR family transcriptional regulator